MAAQDLLFAIEGADVTMFLTREDAERYLEAADVEDNVYQLFSANGARFRMEVVNGKVVLTDEVLENQPERLEKALRTYLLEVPKQRRSLDDTALEDARFETLVKEFVQLRNSS